jgi:hypothetical protein
MTSTDVTVPEELEDVLTSEWLERALATRFPGVRIDDVIPGPVVDARVSTNALFRIEGELPVGLPAALCVKGYFSEAGRAARAAGISEACFYRDLAHVTGVRTLNCVYAEVDRGGHGVVITEDANETGVTFCDALDDCTVDRTADLLGQLAVLHAYGWENAALGRRDWLKPRLAHMLAVRGITEIRANFDGPNGAGVPDQVRDAHMLVEAYGRLVAGTPGARWTVVHGDSHVGNTFIDGQGRAGLLDWQITQYAPWSLDVSYHIASALEPDVRADRERALLRHYLDHLAAAGVVDPPSFEVAWDDYRAGVVHGFFLWGITQFVRPEVITQLLRRLGAAADDHDSFALLAAR